ncbi:MAG: MoxR family ATPase, partial [Sulfurimonas sp.]
PANLLLNAISGAVGKEVAVGFLSFAKVMERLPDINAILQSGEGEYPQAIDVLYALSAGLVSGVLRDVSTLDNVLRYTLELKPEFAVMVVQDLQRNGLSMEHAKAYKSWVQKFLYLLD